MRSLISSEGFSDLILALAHANCDLNQGIGDGLVASELHQFWGHWDSKLVCHVCNLFNIRLGGESGSQSVETGLGVHETLELGSGIIIVRLRIEGNLLLFSLGVSGGNGLIELGLHLSSLDSGSLDGVVFVNELDKVEVVWVVVKLVQSMSELVLEMVSDSGVLLGLH